MDNVRRTVDFAIEMDRIVDRYAAESGYDLRLRAGIDNGAVSSGLVGRSTLTYDVWGATVDLAFRVQRGNPQAGIYVTARVYDVMHDTLEFVAAGESAGEHGTEPVWRLRGHPQ